MTPENGIVSSEDSSRPSAILETCLDVSDVARARAFYADLFGFAVMKADDRFCAFRVAQQQVLILFRRGSDPTGTTLPFGFIPAHGTTGSGHVGFSIPKDSLPAWRRRLEQHGVGVESCFTWPTGGISLYFRDPDGHLLELLTPGVWPIY
ncbi:MAG TPA: VOC family protein [Verrucomicrobiae bacterium]|nr:VOC family protein [Verrucomicrobiae bacterium]